jgi:hypothetical protein
MTTPNLNVSLVVTALGIFFSLFLNMMVVPFGTIEYVALSFVSTGMCIGLAWLAHSRANASPLFLIPAVVIAWSVASFGLVCHYLPGRACFP